MEVQQTPETGGTPESERRAFLARAGRLAVTAPAAATLLLAATANKAQAAYGRGFRLWWDRHHSN